MNFHREKKKREKERKKEKKRKKCLTSLIPLLSYSLPPIIQPRPIILSLLTPGELKSLPINPTPSSTRPRPHALDLPKTERGRKGKKNSFKHFHLKLSQNQLTLAFLPYNLWGKKGRRKTLCMYVCMYVCVSVRVCISSSLVKLFLFS